MGRTKKHRKNKVDFKHCKVTDTTPTHGMPGRPTDVESITHLSYALSAAASIRSDALPVGSEPCGDGE